MSALDNTSISYESAEITCLFLHNRKNDEKINILSVFELVPTEQLASTSIGNHDSYYLERVSIDGTYTIYITRIVGLPVDETIDMYQNAQSGFRLRYDNLDADIKFPYGIDAEPPDDFPLLITNRSEKTLGRILPKRNTAFRVWSKLNIDKGWLEGFDEKKLLSGISNISQEFLGYDLSIIPEHIGNVYLFGCNPLLRSWRTLLLDKNKDLLILFHERNGKSVVGCQIKIQEERAGRIGFTIAQEITSNRQRIKLPYFPDSSTMQIFDQTHQLIESSVGLWTNIHVDMNIQEAELDLTIKSDKNERKVKVSKTTKVMTSKVGKYDRTNAHFLRNAENKRKYLDAVKSREFIYFPNKPESKDLAKKTVTDLLNRAQNRCMILDPYFSAKDLEFAILIRNISISVQIITSSSFLSKKIKIKHKPSCASKWKQKWLYFINAFKKDQWTISYAQMLKESIASYGRIYPQQDIQCKVLRGEKSPLHDRYIIVDNSAYLLGSSLNEFGARATTIIKVPTPQPLIEQADEWWNENDICPTLDSYLKSKVS